VRETLRDIVRRYGELDPTPGAGFDGGRGAPGFGSRSPASDHIIAMLDRRSSPVAHTWVGGDGKLHRELERPPLSVWSVLDTAAWGIAEERGITGPDPAADVGDLVRWIDAQLDWVTRRELVVELDGDLRGLLAQLRPATGDQRVRIGTCPNLPEHAEQECGAPLFAPLRGDTIRCGACGRTWPRPTWERLGQMLQEGRA
jgi:hypothetical protein